MIGSRRIAKLTRMDTRLEAGGETLLFIVHAGRKNSFLKPSEVPDFEGKEAWFEIERVRGRIWPTWKVIRRVEEPKPSGLPQP